MTIVFVLAGVLACMTVSVVGWRYYRWRVRPVFVKHLSFIQHVPRKLAAKERAAIEHYFHHSQPLAGATLLSAPEPAAANVPLTTRNDNVYSVIHSTTAMAWRPMRRINGVTISTTLKCICRRNGDNSLSRTTMLSYMLS